MKTKSSSVVSAFAVVSVVVVIAGCATSQSSREELKSQVVSDVKSQMNPEVQTQISEAKAQVKSELEKEIGAALTSQVKPQLKSELAPQIKAELKAELAAELQKDLTAQIKSDLRTQLKSELKAELAAELKSEMSVPAPTMTASTEPAAQPETEPAPSPVPMPTPQPAAKTEVARSATPALPLEMDMDMPVTKNDGARQTMESMSSSSSIGGMSLFDGRSLDGWVSYQSNPYTFSGADFTEFGSFAKKIIARSTPVAAYINDQLDAATKADLATYSSTAGNAKTVKTAFVRSLNKIIAAKQSVYDPVRFAGVELRPETSQMLKKTPKGTQLTRMNKLLIEDAFPDEMPKTETTIWQVKDAAIASTGGGRGVLYTKADYTHFRLTFQMRHLSGNPDHQAGILIFCSRPVDGEKPLDMLGGIQFQVPNGGHWDYRPGQNVAGDNEFTVLKKAHYNPNEWSQIEIVADARTGYARMAVAQPPGSKASEVLEFKVPEAGKIGPIALQLHNGGLFDEYKDLKIEVDPKSDDLLTMQ